MQIVTVQSGIFDAVSQRAGCNPINESHSARLVLASFESLNESSHWGVCARLAFVSFVPGSEEDAYDLHAALSSLPHFIPVRLGRKPSRASLAPLQSKLN